MLRKSIILCVFVFALFTACNKNETLYKVVGVKDGDTMVLLSPDNQSITVRLAEVDCPEKSQAFGQAAKQLHPTCALVKWCNLLATSMTVMAAR